VALLHHEPLIRFEYFRRSIDPHTPSEAEWVRKPVGQIRTGATRVIAEISAQGKEHSEFGDELVTHPAVAVLRGSLEQYNRLTRPNNTENWWALHVAVHEAMTGRPHFAAHLNPDQMEHDPVLVAKRMAAYDKLRDAVQRPGQANAVQPAIDGAA
jgi:hypothetical protein